MFYLESLNYIDPGTSSFLLQVLLAASATVVVYYKNIKNYILSKFKRK